MMMGEHTTYSAADRSDNFSHFCRDENIPWLRAIKNNDLEFVKERLARTANKHERDVLINGRCTSLYDDLGETAEYILHQYRCDRPMVGGVINGSMDVVECMLEHGGDPLITNDNGNNIAHVVISIVAAHPAQEDNQLRNLVQFLHLLPVATRHKLLKAENRLRLRPLESALATGSIKIFKALFQTPGVYLVEERPCGPRTFQYYDVTEYEYTTRRDRSPLLLLCIVDEETMQKPEFSELLNWPPIMQWIRCKSRAGIMPGVLWALTVWWYVFIYHVIKYNQPLSEGGIPDDTIHGDAGNDGLFIYCPIYGIMPAATLLTKRKFLAALAIYESIHSIVTIVFDIAEFSRISHGKTFLKIVKSGLISRHTFLAQFFMRLVVHLTAWGVMATCITRLIGFTIRGSSWFAICSLLTDLGLFASVNCTLFSIRVVAYNVHTMAEMFLDLIYFMIIGFVATFPHVIFLINFVNTNTQEGCIDDFQDYGHTLYRAVLIMINIKDMTQYDTAANAAFLFGHVVSASILGIYYLNFLIASMTLSVSRMSRLSDVIATLSPLPLALLNDVRISRISRSYPAYFRRRYLTTHPDGGVRLSHIRTTSEACMCSSYSTTIVRGKSQYNTKYPACWSWKCHYAATSRE